MITLKDGPRDTMRGRRSGSGRLLEEGAEERTKEVAEEGTKEVAEERTKEGTV